MGPLLGIRVIEIAGIGPGPFAGMVLADMGAEVILVERSTDPSKTPAPDCNRRGKKSIALNLKNPEDAEKLLSLVETADMLIEGFRPGVMERLGLGPERCLERNPRLIYGRITGWGQTGPLSGSAGHDLNYIALTGALHAMGRADSPPAPPLNLVGDYGGGSMFLVTGLLAAYIESLKSGKGQIVDAAITEGTSLLMSVFYSLDAMGIWTPKRASNLLDSGAHYYDCYETKDGKFISVGAIEQKFYLRLIELCELDPKEWEAQNDQNKWPLYKARLAQVFKTRTREEWCKLLEGTDACFAPVLDYREAALHPHNKARETFFELDGIKQPAPAPRFSRTTSAIRSGSPYAGQHTEEILIELKNDL